MAYAVDRRLYDGRHENVVAEEIFVFIGVGFVGFGIFVVKGAADADTGVVALAGHCVEVGEDGIAQFYGFVHLREVVIGPYHAVDVGAFGGMGAEDGGEHTGLNPTEQQLRVVDILLMVRLMAADVVSPIAVADV